MAPRGVSAAALAVVLVIFTAVGARARRSGAPVCGHTPGHGSLAAGAGDFGIALSASSYNPSTRTPITVTLQTTGASFRGFFLSAYDADGKHVGTFDTTSLPATAKASVCEPVAAVALTHVSNDDKKSVAVTWTPPDSGGVGTVTFKATVVPVVSRYYIVNNIATQVVLAEAPKAPPAPTLASVGGMSATAVKVLWGAAPNNGPAIAGYQLRLNGGAAVYETSDASVAGRTALVSGLAASTAYTLQVRANNTVGWSAWSAAFSVTTVAANAAKPPAPAAATLVSATASGMSIAWSGGKDAAGLPFTRWEVQAMTNSAGGGDYAYNIFRTVHNGDGATTTATIEGLAVGTEYLVRVRSFNVMGESEWSTSAKLSTLAGPGCPNDCSGGGFCDAVSQSCFCDDKHAGKDCSLTAHMVCFRPGVYCLSWAFEGDMAHITMAAKTSGWVGLMLGAEDDRMTKGDAIVGWVLPGGKTVVEDRFSDAFAAPGLDTDLGGASQITGVRGQRNNTHTVISFTRPIKATDEALDRPIATDGETAVGWAFAENGAVAMAFHGSINRGSARVDFSAGSAVSRRNTAMLAHALVMLLAWGLLAPAGAVVAFMARTITGRRTGFFRFERIGFFKAHRALQVSAVVTTIAGACIALIGGRRGFDSLHSWVGLAILVGCLCQALLGFLYHGDAAHGVHRRLGKLLLGLAFFIQIPAGMSLIDWGELGVGLWLGYVAVLFVGVMWWRIDRAAAQARSASSASPYSRDSSSDMDTAKPSVFVRFSMGLDLVLRKQFYALGDYVSRNRCEVAVTSILIALVMSTGLATFVIKTKINEVWVPQGSRPVRAFDDVVANFPSLDLAAAELVFTARPEDPAGPNVLRKDILEDIFRLQNYVESFGVQVSFAGSADASGDRKVSLQDVCATWYDASGCKIWSPLDAWRNNVHEMLDDPDLGATVARANDTFVNSIGDTVDMGEVFGGVKWAATAPGQPRRVESVTALRVTYSLMEDASHEESAYAWQRELKHVIEGWPRDKYRISWYTFAAWDDELARVVDTDTPLFLLVLVTMFVFAVLAVGRPTPRGSRIVLGLAEVGAALLAIMAGFGAASALGFFWGTIHAVLPFVCIGAAVDDFFLIVAAAQQEMEIAGIVPGRARGGASMTAPSSTPASTHHIVAAAMGRIGASITCTSLTSFGAFLMGTMSTIPSVQSFCFYACVAILVDFVLQVTLVVAALAWDIDRFRDGRVDGLTCYYARPEKENDSPAGSAAAASAPAVGDTVDTPYGRGKVLRLRAPAAAGHGSVVEVDLGYGHGLLQADAVRGLQAAAPLPPAEEALRRFYSWALPKKSIRYGTVAFFAVLFFMSLGFMVNVQRGLPSRDVVPDDSHILDLLDTKDIHWTAETGTTVLFTKGFPVADPAYGKKLLDLEDEVLRVVAPFNEMVSWYDELLKFAEDEHASMLTVEVTTAKGVTRKLPSKAVFPGLLKEFLQVPILGPTYARYMRFSRNLDQCLREKEFTCDITAAAYIFENPYYGNLETNLKSVAQMEELYAVCDASDLPAEVFASEYLTLELDVIMVRETAQNLILAVLTVSIVGSVLLVHPQPMALTFAAVCMIDVEVIGLMAAAGVRLNPVSLVFLILSISLSADYVAHIVHAYMQAHGVDGADRRWERVVTAMTNVGVPVARGAGSTFLGLLFVSAANSQIFRTMFVVFALLVLLSVAHGFILLPVLLAWFGTEARAEAHVSLLRVPAEEPDADGHGLPVKSSGKGARPVSPARGGAGAATATDGSNDGEVEMVAVSLGGAAAAAGAYRNGVAKDSMRTNGGSAAPTRAPAGRDGAGSKQRGPLVCACCDSCCKGLYVGVAIFMFLVLVLMTLMGTGVIVRELEEPDTSALAKQRDIALPVNETFTYTMRGHTIPTDRTSYACSGFTAPMDSMRHIIQFEPIINYSFPAAHAAGGTYSPVHHIILYACLAPQPVDAIECWTMPNDCIEFVLAWGVGIQEFVYPPLAGTPMGKGTSAVHFSMQMHYDNYKNVPGIVDYSGFKVRTTSKLRKYDSGILATGARVPLLTVPPLRKRHEVVTQCPPQPTSACPYCDPNQWEELSDGQELTLFAYAVHAHRLGREIWTEHIRDDKVIGVFAEDRAYNFENQRIDMNDPSDWVITKPKDQFRTHCVYDSSDKAEITYGGDETRDEMCLSFMLYYPKTRAAQKDPGLAFCLSDSQPVLSNDGNAAP